MIHREWMASYELRPQRVQAAVNWRLAERSSGLGEQGVLFSARESRENQCPPSSTPGDLHPEEIACNIPVAPSLLIRAN